MSITFKIIDRLFPYVDRRVPYFCIKPGSTVADYGCGPGRYTLPFARITGNAGRVYSVDIHELAIQAVRQRVARAGLTNVRPVLAHGYASGLPGAIADRIFALDVFHGIQQPVEFLAELRRLVKPDGRLVIDAGHQPHGSARVRIIESGLWEIETEPQDHWVCRPAR